MSELIEKVAIADNPEEVLTDEKWRAITHNDASYDEKFIYAVITTGIFCRPSCKYRSNDFRCGFNGGDAQYGLFCHAV